MSNASREVERVRQARSSLEKMRERLLRPTFDALDASAAELDVAMTCLRQLDIGPESPIWQGLTRQRIESEVLALRRTIRSVEELLANAGKFYGGLARLLAPDRAPANYTAAGAAAASAHITRGQFLLHG